MDTVVGEISVGGLDLALERPVDPEELIDPRAFEQDEFLPYWAELWPSGVALADHVAGLEPGEMRIAELGCGLGLPSLVAAALGGHVTALDWSADACRLLRANARRNRVAVEVVEADWRDTEILAGRRFDVVLAADVLYEERNAAPLLDAIARLLADEGTAHVADPGRRHAADFLSAAATSGRLLETHTSDRIPHGGIHVLRAGPPGTA